MPEASTVYILDNGGCYSNHKIYFVEPKPEEVPVLEELVATFVKAWPNGVCKRCGSRTREVGDKRNHIRYETFHLLGKVKAAEWFTGRAGIAAIAEDMEFKILEECEDVEAAARCFALCKQILDPTGGGWFVDRDFVARRPGGECVVMR